LQVLGGIEISSDQLDASQEWLFDDVIFEPRTSMLDTIRRLEEMTGKQYFPIGEIDGHPDILVDEEGAWYETFCGGLWRIGKDSRSSMRYILFREGEYVEILRPGP